MAQPRPGDLAFLVTVLVVGDDATAFTERVSTRTDVETARRASSALEGALRIPAPPGPSAG